MTALVRGDVVVATEHIQAPVEVVFPYFTDPVLLASWLGERADLNPRAGGRFAVDFGYGGSVQGTYLMVDPPHRVVFTWGVPGRTDLPPGSSTVEVVLTPDGADTLVVLTHRGLPEPELEKHREGWERQLSGLRPIG